MTHRRRTTGPQLWMAAAQANLDMWTTLSHRVPMLLTGQASPAEQSRMVTEKIAAMTAASQAMASALGRAAWRGPSSDPFGMVETALDIMSAGARPYHTRLGANAKRLSRRKG